MKRALLGLILLAAAAGCHHKDADTTPGPDPLASQVQGGGEAPARDESSDMIAPEKMEEIQKDLDRKRESVSRCLATVIDNKELPKNSKGNKTLEIVIEGGRATSVKVVKESITSKELDDCVIGKVKEIEFPSLQKTYETSYTYTFEAI